MTTDTSYTPLDNPDLTDIDPATLGVDTNISTQAINSKQQTLTLTDDVLNVGKNANFTNNVTVSGITYNSDLTNKLNDKSSKISMAPATIVLGQSADFTYFGDENSLSYPLLSSDDIVWSKHNDNIKLSISDTYKDNLTSALSSTYASIDDLSNFETTVSMLSDVYQPIGDYVTDLSTLESIYQPLGDYITDLSTLASVYQPIGDYVTDLTTLASVYQPIGSYVTTLTPLASVYQPVGSYVTTLTPLASVCQPIGNYVTTLSTLASVYQPLGDYVTTLTPLASVYQSITNMNTSVTSASITNTVTSFLTLSGASGTYQSIINMSTYVTSGSITNTLTSYLTSSGASSTYAPINNQSFTGTVTLSGTDITTLYQPKFIVAGYVQSTGTFGGSYGKVGFSSARTGTGAYTLTFSSNIGSVVSSVIGGLRNAVGYMSYTGTSANAVNVQAYTTAGALADNASNFYILM